MREMRENIDQEEGREGSIMVGNIRLEHLLYNLAVLDMEERGIIPRGLWPLIESYCSTPRRRQHYECPYGCVDGACL